MILFTAGARLIPAAQAGLITLLEIVLGPLWVWLIYREQPDALTLVGGAVIIVRGALARDLRSAARIARSAPGHVVRAGGSGCQMTHAPCAIWTSPTRFLRPAHGGRFAERNSSGVVRVVSALPSGTHDVSHLDDRHAPATARHIPGAGRHGTLTP